MSGVYDGVLDMIGRTPMVKLSRISRDVPGEIWGKLELLNPSGSVKDRIALAMLEGAEARGDIAPGTTIIEPTSGNTGIALALVCALKGYPMIAVLPEAMSQERRALLKYLGAELELVPCVAGPDCGFTKEDIENTLKRALELSEMTPDSWVPNQFENPDNPKAHEHTTAREIIEQTGGRLDAFVASCGTGGTFSGVAAVLKREFPDVRNVVVEPERSAVMSGCAPGFHKIEGIGEGFIPVTMDTELADDVVQVLCEDAIDLALRLAREEGILCGISGGANVYAAMEVSRSMGPESIVVTIIPDNVARYFSTDLFAICSDKAVSHTEG
jgi:cysteine synthase A